VRERISENADQRRKPEHDIVEMDEWDVRDQIGLERAVEIKENKEDGGRDDPDPELLLLGSIVRHVRRLVACAFKDGKSFRRDVKTGVTAGVSHIRQRRDGTS
jgi:hypothetical protein